MIDYYQDNHLEKEAWTLSDTLRKQMKKVGTDLHQIEDATDIEWKKVEDRMYADTTLSIKDLYLIARAMGMKVDII